MSTSDPMLGSAGVPVWMGAFEVVVIGASFGGPPAVERVLAELPRGFAVPVVICQHISPGHTAQWAELLNGRCKLRVAEAVRGESLEPGRAYVAPAGRHLRFMRAGAASPHGSASTPTSPIRCTCPRST